MSQQLFKQSDIVGKCSYCNRDITLSDLSAGTVEAGMYSSVKVFRCIHCQKILSITYNPSY